MGYALIISYILFAIILVFLLTNKTEVSTERALRDLKKSLVRLIVFYQANYSAADQIVLVKKWMEDIKKNKIPKEQFGLFKEFVRDFDMKFDKEKLYEDALELSEREEFFFVQDLIDYLTCGRTTFYTFFHDGSDELNALKANLYKNRIQKKVKLRKKLEAGSGSELIALYKLVGNDEERKRLSTSYNDLTTGGEKIKQDTKVIFVNARNNDSKEKDD